MWLLDFLAELSESFSAPALVIHIVQQRPGTASPRLPSSAPVWAMESSPPLPQQEADTQVWLPCPTPAIPGSDCSGGAQAAVPVAPQHVSDCFKNFLGYRPGGSRAGPGVSAVQQGWDGCVSVVLSRSVSIPLLTGQSREHHNALICCECPFRDPL